MILKKRVNRIRVFTMAGTCVNAIKTDPEQNLVGKICHINSSH